MFDISRWQEIISNNQKDAMQQPYPPRITAPQLSWYQSTQLPWQYIYTAFLNYPNLITTIFLTPVNIHRMMSSDLFFCVFSMHYIAQHDQNQHNGVRYVPFKAPLFARLNCLNFAWFAKVSSSQPSLSKRHRAEPVTYRNAITYRNLPYSTPNPTVPSVRSRVPQWTCADRGGRCTNRAACTCWN